MNIPRVLGFLAALFFVAFLPAPAFAVLCGVGGGQCFVVAAGGNSATASTWSATSGGTTCSGTTCATGPAATDSVCLDSAGGNLTLNALLTVVAFDESGTCAGGSGSPYVGTLNAGSQLTLTNGTKFYVSAGSTWTGANQTITLSPASGVTLPVTTNGKGINPITITGADNTAIVQLQDTLNAYTPYNGGQSIIVTTGKFDTNNQAVNGYNLASSNNNVRAINCGTSSFTLNAALGGNVPFNISTGGTPTFTCTGATFNFTNTSTTAGAAQLFPSGSGSNAWGTMTFNKGGGGGYFINGAFTLGTLNLNDASLYMATTITVTTFTSTTSAGHYPLLSSSSSLSQQTLSVASGTVNCKCIVRGIIGSGGATFTANPGFDAGDNTNWTFTAPASGGGGGIIGG
jgi:hypothetical protein